MRTRMTLLAALFLAVFGCQTTYYKGWELFGKEKRHLLKDNVEKARDEQEKASEQFKDALTRVKEIYGFDGGDLEDFYNKLSRDYDGCKRRAEAVEGRIDTVEEIASDLFDEWENEIDDITNAQLKAKSRQSLEETKVRYDRLSDAMIKARDRMDPALHHLQDYVLYLKHNLNAQAIGALRQEVDDIEVEVAALIKDMTKSIQEADEFLKTLE
jgi:hypothetical protein